MRRQPEVLRSLRRLHQLIDRPFLPGRRVVADFRGGEAVEGQIVGRMDRDELALEMGGKLRQLHAGFGQRSLDLVAVGLAFGGAGEVEQAGVPGRDLHALEAVPRRPSRDGAEVVERIGIARELGEEDGWSLDRLHLVRSSRSTGAASY